MLRYGGFFKNSQMKITRDTRKLGYYEWGTFLLPSPFIDYEEYTSGTKEIAFGFIFWRKRFYILIEF